ncbi:MAG: addiction module protein [Deltaproteobacteria bacterium]|nr:addiction module protein [Deltaproteobacteria bacterium]
MNFEKLKEEALKLDIHEREMLVTDLIDSIHQNEEVFELDDAWKEEIERRTADIENNKACWLSEEEFWGKINENIKCLKKS